MHGTRIRGRSRCGMVGSVSMYFQEIKEHLVSCKYGAIASLDPGRQHDMPSLSFHSILTSTNYGPQVLSYIHGLHPSYSDYAFL
jgi:hypothetical protein